MAPFLLSTGVIVDVDPEHRTGRPDSDGGRAFVLKSHDNGTVDVKYVVAKLRSPNVKLNRIHPAVIATTGRARSQESSNGIRPSLISLDFAPMVARRQRALPMARNQQQAKQTTTAILTTDELFEISRAPNGGTRVAEYLEKANSKHVAGWLRTAECSRANRPAPKPRAHLSADEKQQLFLLHNLIRGTRKGRYDKTSALISFAWGVSPRTVEYIDSKGGKASGTTDFVRKKRRDAGTSIFTCKAKVNATITPQSVFKKTKRRESMGAELLSEADLREEWQDLSEEQQQNFKYPSDQMRQQALHLKEETTKVLKRTNGRITWRRLASEVSGGQGTIPLVSHVTMMRYVMSLPESSYTTTKIHPLLTDSAKKRRLVWTTAFWIFWNSAVLLAAKTQIVLVHMDEKWFYAVVVRRHNKWVPFLGVEPYQPHVHHKSHIHKVMGIASTAFAPHGNDMERGGRAFKVSLTRVGGMRAAKKDTYKRVYHSDGSFSYPKIAANRLRKRGELYFQPFEITGSSRGTEKKPKFSLLEYYERVELPKLDKLARELTAQLGRKIVIRYQMDGAGPHQDAMLNEFLNSQFDERGWMIKSQPSNSPLLNTKDACIFPAMSKAVTEEQGVAKGSCVLEGEELWSTVERVWDRLGLDVIARAYAGHHQIVNAVAQSEGGDDFAQKRGGLHCGIRKLCVPVYEGDTGTQPSGVEIVASFETNAEDERATRGLRYRTPIVSDKSFLEHLNRQEVDFLMEHLPRQSSAWETLAIESLREAYNSGELLDYPNCDDDDDGELPASALGR